MKMPCEISRSQFLKGSFSSAAMVAAFPQTALFSLADDGCVPERNRHPYADVDWRKTIRVNTTSHVHCPQMKTFKALLDWGLEFLTFSNYYPSAPYFPAKKMTDGYYRVHHDFPVMVNGERTAGPFNWSSIISNWKEELGAHYANGVKFKEGGPLFNVPEGFLEAPNAEHHRFKLDDGSSAGALHLCAPGSMFASGTFDAHDIYKTLSHGYDYGSGEKWRCAVDRMLESLLYPEGGGVTINHPARSQLEDSLIFDMLDHDPRVLGIEVFNYAVVAKKHCPWSRQNCEDYWDRALSTGRQCFGFFVPDWGLPDPISGKAVYEGLNILLVREKTARECLRAYREGNFYGAIKGAGALAFTSISFDGNRLAATVDKPAKLQMISKSGVVAEKFGMSLAHTGFDRKRDIYLRVKAVAADDSKEVLYSQPIMLS